MPFYLLFIFVTMIAPFIVYFYAHFSNKEWYAVKRRLDGKYIAYQFIGDALIRSTECQNQELAFKVVHEAWLFGGKVVVLNDNVSVGRFQTPKISILDINQKAGPVDKFGEIKFKDRKMSFVVDDKIAMSITTINNSDTSNIIVEDSLPLLIQKLNSKRFL